jgi:putative ABC transport system permease protein
MLDTLIRDVRFARRSLMRAGPLSIAAVLSIALGVSAATSVFSVVDAALFRPPPFPSVDRLAMLFVTRQHPNAPITRERWSWPRSRLLRERATSSFSQIASFSPAVLAITGAESDPEPANAEVVSSSYWSTLEVSPMLGRSFTADEDVESGAHPEVIVGYDLWQRRFGSDSALIGRTIGVNGVALTVVGIAPRGFAGLSGRAQLWIPATMAPRVSYIGYLVTNQNFISVVGRLRDGVTLEHARAELALVGKEIQRVLPSEASNPSTVFGSTAISLTEARIDPSTRRPLFLLLAGAVCLLLLACVNVAGLLLGRAISRRREIAIRVATGASPGRIAQQLLVESALLAMAGGLIAALAAVPIAGRIVFPSPASRGRNFYGALGEFATPHVDVRVLVFCVLLCLVTTLAFGLLPALRATRVDLPTALRDGAGAGIARTARRVSARQTIVASEAALAVVLLMCAGLLLASWHRLDAADTGFNRTHLLTFMLRPSEVVYPAPKAPALIERVLTEIERVPGVEAATVDGCAPVAVGCANSTLFVVGRPTPPPDEAPPVLRHYVGPNHFRVLGVPLIRGRTFSSSDRAGSPRVAIIDQTAAKRFWPNEDPIGKRVWFGGGSNFDRPDSSAEIVGIVGDVAYQPLDEHPFQPNFYTPFAQFTYASRMVLVRSRDEPSALVAAIRRAVHDADPELALFEVETMDERMHDAWARLSYQMRLLGAFATTAVLLAAMGIFAVITQAVGDRRREIGVRVALGATPAAIISSVGRHGARPAMIGVGVGLFASVLMARVLSSMLYGVRALDPPVLAAVVFVAVAVTLLATYLASRRALSIEPVEAMRAL